MPRGNGMGPMGAGPMTGRRAGFCAGNGQAGATVPGTGRGCGFGRGFRNMFFATGLPGWMRAGGTDTPASAVVTDAEKQALANQAKALQAQLDGFRQRLEQLENQSETEG